MKQLLLALLLVTAMAVAMSPQKLLNRPMPSVTGVTLKGTTIDTAYFKGKVTLINFMSIGCQYCMGELKTLAQLHQGMKDRSDFQILCIAPQTAAQLRDFNSSNEMGFSSIRRHYKVDSIPYEILPECAQERGVSKPTVDGGFILGPECNTISKPFKVDGYPVTFLIDKHRIVREVYVGYNLADTSMATKMQVQIEQLLAQNP